MVFSGGCITYCSVVSMFYFKIVKFISCWNTKACSYLTCSFIMASRGAMFSFLDNDYNNILHIIYREYKLFTTLNRQQKLLCFNYKDFNLLWDCKFGNRYKCLGSSLCVSHYILCSPITFIIIDTNMCSSFRRLMCLFLSIAVLLQNTLAVVKVA